MVWVLGDELEDWTRKDEGVGVGICQGVMLEWELEEGEVISGVMDVGKMY